MTFEQVLRAYDRGELTRNEFVVHTLTLVSARLETVETVETALRRRPEDLSVLVDWVEDVLSGAEVWSSAGHVTPITDDGRAVLARFRDRVRASETRSRGGS